MTKLRPRQEMKDSGSEWIRQIPQKWNTIRFKHVHENANVGMSIDRNYWSDDEKDITFYTAQIKPIHVCYEDFPEWKYTSENDLLLARNATPYVYLPVPRAAYTDHIIRVDINPGFDRRFIRYCLQQSIEHEVANGVSLPTWSVSIWNRQIVPLPTIEEQKIIADYLDDYCKKIDEIITEATSSIEEYKDLKRSVIFEAVTQGINKTVSMKDSGIAWIGQIPRTWSLVRIPRVLDYNDSYPLGDGDHGMIKTEDYRDAGIPYIRVQNLGWGTELLLDNVVFISEEDNAKIKSSQLKPNDVLFCKTGGTIGKTGMVPEDLPISNTTSHVGKITVSHEYNARFVFYVLSSNIGYRQFWEIACQKTTRPEISIAEARQIRITLPPSRKEQDDIVKYLDERVLKLDAIILAKQRLIDDLHAYKKSIVYEVITGKRKVV